MVWSRVAAMLALLFFLQGNLWPAPESVPAWMEEHGIPLLGGTTYPTSVEVRVDGDRLLTQLAYSVEGARLLRVVEETDRGLTVHVFCEAPPWWVIGVPAGSAPVPVSRTYWPAHARPESQNDISLGRVLAWHDSWDMDRTDPALLQHVKVGLWAGQHHLVLDPPFLDLRAEVSLDAQGQPTRVFYHLDGTSREARFTYGLAEVVEEGTECAAPAQLPHFMRPRPPAPPPPVPDGPAETPSPTLVARLAPTMPDPDAPAPAPVEAPCVRTWPAGPGTGPFTLPLDLPRFDDGPFHATVTISLPAQDWSMMAPVDAFVLCDA